MSLTISLDLGKYVMVGDMEVKFVENMGYKQIRLRFTGPSDIIIRREGVASLPPEFTTTTVSSTVKRKRLVWINK